MKTLLLASFVASLIPGFNRERAGRDWRDGILVGNGETAAMAYAPAHFEWVINRNDLFDGSVAECQYLKHADVVKKFEGMAFKHTRNLEDKPKGNTSLRETVSAAYLRVRPWAGIGWAAPSPPRVAESLSMKDGMLTAKMTSPIYATQAETIIPRGWDVLAVRVSDPNFPSRRLKIELVPIEDARIGAPVKKTIDGTEAFTRKLPDGRSFAVAMRVKDGKEIFVAVRTSRGCSDPLVAAIEAVGKAADAGFAALQADTAKWWHAFWEKGGRAHFPDNPALERQWYFSLYALASQYGKAPMPGLNGLTYGPIDSTVPGVSSQGYTHDQNVQIPMFAFFPLNHAEFLVSFADTYLEGLGHLKEQTRERFGTDGVSIPLNMNQDCTELPVGGYRYTLCGSAYSGLVLSLAWRYSHDRELLEKKIYPLLKEFAAFYLGLSQRGADGIYHFDWMVPPEIFTVTRDESSMISMFKTCLETLVETSELLGQDADLRTKWQDVLAHYPTPAKLPSGAWWCGPDVSEDHKMWGGHLFYPFFPSEAYSDDLDAARKTLEYARTEAIEMEFGWRKPYPVHDWSAFYQTATAIRLADRKLGQEMLQDFFDWFGKPNGLFAHNPVIIDEWTYEDLQRTVKKTPEWRKRTHTGELGESVWRAGGSGISSDPDAKRLISPVIEGGSGFLFLTTETLLQSWGGKIRLFPCVPEKFTGSFENFRAQGGYTVSAAMENGRLKSYSIVPEPPKNTVIFP